MLLKALQAQADKAGWLTVEIEGTQTASQQDQTRQRLARALVTSARALTPPRRTSQAWQRALATISAFSVAVGPLGMTATLGVDPARGRADSGDPSIDVEELVSDLVPALKESGIALAVFVDEIQDLDAATLSALIATQHRASQKGWPFHLYGAGLPNVPGRMAEVHSYAERFHFMRIGALSARDARSALESPAAAEGVSFTEPAVERLVQVSGGYPYFIQVYGDQAWRNAPGPSSITYDDALAAVTTGTAVLDESLFHSRWDRATPAQKHLMRAMAEDRSSSQLSDLVSRLGKRRPSDLSVARDALIKKGLIFAPDRGMLQFTVPHMDDYIRRQHEG